MDSYEGNLKTALTFYPGEPLGLFLLWVGFSSCFFSAYNPGPNSCEYIGKQSWDKLWVDGSDLSFTDMFR